MGKRYIPPETKRRALELLAGGMNQLDAATEMDVASSSISLWKRDAILSGEWDKLVEAARFNREAEKAGAQPAAPEPQPKAETRAPYRQPDSPPGSPFLGFGWRPSDAPEPPTPSTPMSEMTVGITCTLCGRLMQQHEAFPGRKMGICPECLALLRGVMDRERSNQGNEVPAAPALGESDP